MRRIIKIGKNRDNPRLWLEGKCLAAMGWNKGDKFNCYFGDKYGANQPDPDGERITYIKFRDGMRKVAGTDQRPIIDTNNKNIEDIAKDYTHMEVVITKDQITFTPCDAPESVAKRVAKKVGKLAQIVALSAVPFFGQMDLKAKSILVTCEWSATLRNEFAKRGHDVVSCDVLDTADPTGWHIKGDVTPYLDQYWDMVVGFPPCTVLTVSAAWAFKDPDFDKYPGVGYHQKVKPGTLVGQDRVNARLEAISFVKRIWDSSEHVCIENPKGFLSSMWQKPTQIVNPNQYGHNHSKETCLFLKNLDKIQPTDVLNIEDHGWLVTEGPHAGKWRWHNQTAGGQNNLPPTADRDKLRGKTYTGIAKAMAATWTEDLS